MKPVECPCPPHRRPSCDSRIRPSLTDARPSSARQKSVDSPCAVRQKSVVGRSPRDRRSSVRSPCKVRQKPVKCPFPVCVRVCQKPVVRPCAARYPSVISPWLARRKSAAPPRRPSRNSWIRPSLTDARPSPVRVKSVIRPWCARVASAALCFTSTICRLWLPPCEPPRDLPPRTNATRTNTRRTPHRTRPNAERTTDEHTRARSTSDPLNSADRQSPVPSPSQVRGRVTCPA